MKNNIDEILGEFSDSQSKDIYETKDWEEVITRAKKRKDKARKALYELMSEVIDE